MLSSYTSRGILTLNEARAALGRAPLADPAADRPMALVATGYVPLTGAGPVKAAGLGKAGEWDEDRHSRWPAGAGDNQGGRFAPAGETGSPTQPEASDGRANRQEVAEVVPICTRGSHSAGRLDNGLTYYWAEYNCFDGRTIELRSLGKPLDGIIPQPR